MLSWIFIFRSSFFLVNWIKFHTDIHAWDFSSINNEIKIQEHWEIIYWKTLQNYLHKCIENTIHADLMNRYFYITLSFTSLLSSLAILYFTSSSYLLSHLIDVMGSITKADAWGKNMSRREGEKERKKRRPSERKRKRESAACSR